MTHEMTEACRDFHCAFHQEDEAEAKDGYLCCGECWHLFVTEQDLLDAVAQNHRDLGITTTIKSADEITFCPLCAHDF